ncbi:hypothetical protein XENTR_v10000829 [Xenopus tropicalis]|nr:hypothetical protein XENTR_v10000829 [Xenopus tropicalis]
MWFCFLIEGEIQKYYYSNNNLLWINKCIYSALSSQTIIPYQSGQKLSPKHVIFVVKPKIMASIETKSDSTNGR